MAQALEADPRYAVALHHEGGVGLGRVGLPSFGSQHEVVWNREQTRCLVLEGELYDVARLRQSLSEAGDRSEIRNQAALLLALYERFGADAIATLNGAFVAAMWDRQARQLVVFNDRLGLFPLYYARVGEDLLFGSGVRALLADPALNRAVDHVAINQFLVFDHVLDDRTMLSSVRLLPQGSILTLRDGRLCIRRYWTPRYPEVYEPQAEEAYVEQFAHYLRQAVARQQPDDRPTAVLLSGGLDSRLLLGPLVEQGHDVQTLTFGIPGCDDASVAAELAKRLGTRHRFFELKADWLLEKAGEAVRVTDGLANIVNMHVLATSEEQGRHAEVVYKGFLGDAILGFALKPQMWGDYSRDTSYDVHLAVHRSHGVINYDEREQGRLLTDAFRASVGDGVARAYRTGMDKAGVSQLANQRLYFDLTQRVPRMTLNGVEAARGRTVVRLPFADNDLVDFVLGVPPGFLFERRLPKAALVKYFPKLAQIPLASTGRPLTSCSRDIYIQARQLLAWHLRKHGLGWLAGRERQPYKDYDKWFRNGLRPWAEGVLLEPRTLNRGYFRPDSIRRLLAEHASGTNHAVRLGALLTVELWHRQFVD
jgi:asparagine synthase (glutamine-hydrolysing)